MNRYRPTNLALALALVSVSSCSSSDTLRASDTTAALAAAVTKVRGDFAPGRMKIGIADTTRASSEVNRAVAAALGADVGTVAASRLCQRGPSSCRIVDAALLVEVTRYSLAGSGGEVSLNLYEQTTSKRQPVHVVRLVVTLVHTGANWAASSVKVLSET